MTYSSERSRALNFIDDAGVKRFLSESEAKLDHSVVGELIAYYTAAFSHAGIDGVTAHTATPIACLKIGTDEESGKQQYVVDLAVRTEYEGVYFLMRDLPVYIGVDHSLSNKPYVLFDVNHVESVLDTCEFGYDDLASLDEGEAVTQVAPSGVTLQ